MVADAKIRFIFNRSLEKGIFSSEWKEAIVVLMMSPPIESFSSLKVKELIRRLNPRKASEHDPIINKAIKELPKKGLHSSLLFLMPFFALNIILSLGKYY